MRYDFHPCTREIEIEIESEEAEEEEEERFSTVYLLRVYSPYAPVGRVVGLFEARNLSVRRRFKTLVGERKLDIERGCVGVIDPRSEPRESRLVHRIRVPVVASPVVGVRKQRFRFIVQQNRTCVPDWTRLVLESY